MTDDNQTEIVEIAGGVSIKVYVAPRASMNRVVGVHNGALKVALTAPPVEGAANKALVDFLSKMLGVPKGAVVLTSGATTRNKVVQVQDISLSMAVAKLTVTRDE